MSNESETDLEKKFQEDLEKATALSLETLALDQFRRTKLQYSHSDVSKSNRSIQNKKKYINQKSAETIDNCLKQNYTHLPPPPSVPPRRHSEIKFKEKCDDDLISFVSPNVIKKETNITLDNLIDDIEKLNSKPQTIKNSFGLDKTAITSNIYNTQGIDFNQYQKQNKFIQAHNEPLTGEKLNLLYNMQPQMPYYQQNYYPHEIRFIQPQTTSSAIIPFNYQQLPYGFKTNLIFNNNPESISQITKFDKNQTSQNITKTKSDETLDETAKVPQITIQANNTNNLYSEVIKRPKQSLENQDLIDWGNEDTDSLRVSVLEAFDPLVLKERNEQGGNNNECAVSYYSEYDPFDYLYNCGTQYSDPVYEAVNKTDRTPQSPAASIGWNILTSNNGKLSPPPPLPPRNSIGLNDDNQSKQFLDKKKFSKKLYEYITDRKIHDPEMMEFYRMVKELRSEYKFIDEKTNIGCIIASEFNNQYPERTSIKLLVYPSIDILNEDNDSIKESQIIGYGSPIVFTCDINTTVEHVILHVFCALEGKILYSMNDLIMKPIGLNEWLSASSKLNQLECVHNSIKLEKDVQLGLCYKNELKIKTIARTQKDDIRDSELKPEDILPNEHISTISFDNMMILIETLETEIDKLEISSSDIPGRTMISCSCVVQATKAICALLGSIDTPDIIQNIDDLKDICSVNQTVLRYNSGTNPDIISESGDYAEITLRPKSLSEQIQLKCSQIREAILELIQNYTNAFRVNFCVKSIEYEISPISVSCVIKPIMVNIICLHRPSPNWKYDDYILGTQIYHGTRYISLPIVTKCTNDISGGFFPSLKFKSWTSFDNNPICSLPRESRFIFVLYGCCTETAEGDQNNENNLEKKQITTELGWGSIQLFDFQSNMISGTYLLSIWPPTTDKYLGPAPPKGSHPQPDICPVLSIEIPSYNGTVTFPKLLKDLPSAPKYDFNSLDCNLQQELLDTAEQGYLAGVDKREVLWEKRHYLQSFPFALPKVLHAAHSWDFASLIDLHSLLHSWHSLTPLQSLELLLPRYPDLEVRSKAVKWISKMSNDQLVVFLPQLLQALKHDTYEASPMAKFLLCKCLESPRIAHHLYWLLVHSLPGDSPQNSIDANETDIDCTLITQARYHLRNKMMLRALLAICGEKLLSKFLAQNVICMHLAEAAQNVKKSKESLRQKTLFQSMDIVNQILIEKPTFLPLGPGLEVCGVNIRNCNYFNSNTLPLKISFLGPDNNILPAIFKSGDDLQQDMLTIQLVRTMDRLWLEEGLDLKMVTFNCVPTGYKKGMIELITDAETLRKIQIEYGLTGSFKDRPIAEWLARQNPSQLEYQRAVDNFTVSCAGYSVATYILGICDRHNDNIMLKTSGHLFHIDFGKFLGDAQMFGNFKRDRTPFVLTSDMAYVINGGDKLSTKFHHFVDLCCKAFNIVRKHGDLILHMLALMAAAGIPGVTADAVTYVRRALLPSQSNPEAAASFAKMIQFSLKSWFTQFNFFLHNLSQLRFSGDDCNGEILSFVPRKYTVQQDGRLKCVIVHGFQKRYDLEKYYTYILKVTRQGQPDPAYLFRSYKEFSEFHQKLCLHFPLAKLHSLPSGIHVGRSNIKTVAERRLPEIQQFLVSLFNSADEIAHSDLVYTFFHPLLRDQQEADIHVPKVKTVHQIQPTENVCGEVKLSFQYRRGALTVMVHHARGLPTLSGNQEPNTYVKCYLKPDPTKATKRKTKVIRKTCVPSFMETLEYRMPIEHIHNRILHVTVWSHDTLQENELLGGFEIILSNLDLHEEVVKWFRLGNISKR